MATDPVDIAANLGDRIAEARADAEFAARLAASIERNKPILDRLASEPNPLRSCDACGAPLERCPPMCSRWFCPHCDIKPEERR